MAKRESPPRGAGSKEPNYPELPRNEAPPELLRTLRYVARLRSKVGAAPAT